jgi:iron-sulfur cluster repair protein YtfE (RIC family)
VEVCATLAEVPEQIEELGAELGTLAAKLDEDFEAHLAREEQVIFPAVRALLNFEEQDRLLAQLRQRRSH